MQEHPVPQNVTGYEFHLIGQMTLKQFMEVAGGVLVAVIVNATNLPQFIKYPLMLIAGLAGAALAFVPLEGRPLDRWFFAFIKSIYQPTMFFWKKSDSTPPVFTYTQPSGVDSSPKVDYTPIRQARVREFIHTVTPAKTTTQTDEESSAATAVLSLFSAPDLPKISAEPVEKIVPRTPSIKPAQDKNTTPAPMGHIVEMTIESATPLASPIPKPQPVSQLPTPGGIIHTNTTIGYADKNGVSLPPPSSSTASTPIPVYDGKMEAVLQTQPATADKGPRIKPVQPLNGFPFPNKPTTPNMVAGMVVNLENKLIENAIVTILRESDRTPVRAMKTNTLGQFAVVTALAPDSYILTVEKDGFSFDNYSLHIDNTVIQPILLKANR